MSKFRKTSTVFHLVLLALPLVALINQYVSSVQIVTGDMVSGLVIWGSAVALTYHILQRLPIYEKLAAGEGGTTLLQVVLHGVLILLITIIFLLILMGLVILADAIQVASITSH